MNDDDLIRDLAALGRDETPDRLVERMLADAAFTAARRDAPVPGEMLMARIDRDARDVAARRRRSEWMTWGGLIAACAMGLAVGLTDLVSVLPGETSATYAVDDLGGGYDFQFAEVEG